MLSETNWHSEQLGSGDTQFIWLHGWGHDLTAFQRMAGLFVGCGTHTLYDQPGFGRTPPLTEGASTKDYADQLATQLNSTKGAIIVGHSYGGRVAVQLAAHYPEKVKAIILIGGAGLKRHRSINFRLRAFCLKKLGQLARFCDTIFKTDFRSQYVSRFGSSDYKNAGPLRGTLVSAVNEDLSAEARAVSCPALMVYGSDDTETPPEIGRKYETLIPIARFEELKGYGHTDILSRGAYQCEALMKAFLKDLGDD